MHCTIITAFKDCYLRIAVKQSNIWNLPFMFNSNSVFIHWFILELVKCMKLPYFDRYIIYTYKFTPAVVLGL